MNKHLSHLPSAIVVSDESLADRPAIFSRPRISKALGGSLQCSLVRNTKPNTQTGPAVPLLLCPRLDWNPLSPSRPGCHGVLFLGRVDTHTTTSTPPYGAIYFDYHDKNKLCQTPPEGIPIFFFLATSQWQYYGHYRLHQSTPLTGGEWSNLPLKVRILPFR